MDVLDKLAQLRKFAVEKYIPVLKECTANILKEWLEKTKPKFILEIGTSIGTSGIFSLSVAKNAYLVSIEKNQQVFLMARENFRELGLLDRVNLVLGDCFEVLMLLDDKFDFVILDGPKGHNMELLDLVFPLLNNGGIIFVDNINYHNKIKASGVVPHKHRTIVKSMREFIGYIKNSKDMNVCFYDDGDGIAVIQKLGNYEKS